MRYHPATIAGLVSSCIPYSSPLPHSMYVSSLLYSSLDSTPHFYSPLHYCSTPHSCLDCASNSPPSFPRFLPTAICYSALDSTARSTHFTPHSTDPSAALTPGSHSTHCSPPHSIPTPPPPTASAPLSAPYSSPQSTPHPNPCVSTFSYTHEIPTSLPCE